MLRQALALDPQSAAAHHALSLLLIRQQRLPEALIALAEVARLDEDNSRYGGSVLDVDMKIHNLLIRSYLIKPISRSETPPVQWRLHVV
ncbi:MAG: tetratricopeptide repeat protein [Candidatus Competibacteraceae bacterium]